MRKTPSGQRPRRSGGPGPSAGPGRQGSKASVTKSNNAKGKAGQGKPHAPGRPGGVRAGGQNSGDARPSGGGKRRRVGRGPKAMTSAVPVSAPLSEPMWIAKAMARAGLCSRREAVRWVAEGRVTVNGKILSTPACEVGPGDIVLVDGRALPAAESVRLWRYHKPKGLVTTHRDPQGRPTVFEKLPPEMPRVISIGRLDFNTEGLLLLTNDGALARHLELPATGWLRRYRVRARGRVTQADLDRLKDGVEIEGVRYGPVDALIDSVQGANTWLTIGIREGKNREVRKVMASLGLEVSRLIRISFGPFELGDLAPGSVDAVRRKHLAEQLGPKVAGEFGLSETAEARKERHARGKQKASPAKEEEA